MTPAAYGDSARGNADETARAHDDHDHRRPLGHGGRDHDDDDHHPPPPTVNAATAAAAGTRPGLRGNG